MMNYGPVGGANTEAGVACQNKGRDGRGQTNEHCAPVQQQVGT